MKGWIACLLILVSSSAAFAAHTEAEATAKQQACLQDAENASVGKCNSDTAWNDCNYAKSIAWTQYGCYTGEDAGECFTALQNADAAMVIADDKAIDAEWWQNTMGLMDLRFGDDWYNQSDWDMAYDCYGRASLHYQSAVTKYDEAVSQYHACQFAYEFLAAIMENPE